MYCRNCGAAIADDASFCTECGSPVVKPATPETPVVEAEATPVMPAPPVYEAPQVDASYYAPTTPAAPAAPEDKGGFGWGLLGCCIPLVGLILFLVWKDTKPKSAKAAGIGALVSVGITVVFYIIAAALGVGASILGSAF